MADLFDSASGKSNGYSAEDIEVLEGLEPVRRRPGMFIGGTDARALHHLAAEVLDNAMDEAVAGHASRIEIELAAAPLPALTVRDFGPGVAPEERALIFERFQRGRDTGGEAGFGLGLAIGRELAERMDGSLELADTRSAGATFVLTLREIPADEPAPRRPSLAARQH